MNFIAELRFWSSLSIKRSNHVAAYPPYDMHAVKFKSTDFPSEIYDH